ncbi:MAG: DNA repair protein RadC [Finegoldia sp.]|nr:DNA repair protein RadC [Finegoldia sp.]
MRIKDKDVNSRPREKMKLNGVDSLSDCELMQIILKTGTKECSVEDLSSLVLDSINNGGDCIEELMNIKGVGLAKATSIVAGIELGKRLALRDSMKKVTVTNPKTVADIFCQKIGNESVEYFYVLLLDTKKSIISIELISKGTINASIIHPREVFRQAIKKNADSIILVHNHPSRNLTPSKSDIDISKRLIEVGKLVGIEVVDHIIVTRCDFLSMKKGMYI